MIEDLPQSPVVCHTLGCRVYLHVVPRSSKTRCVGRHGGRLKVQVAAPPVEGAANKALREFLAKRLNVPKRQVSCVSGHTGRHKCFEVEGVFESEEVEAKLLG